MRDIKFKKDQLYFVPLGGCGHFGANLNLYHYDGQWLAIDCGMGFADERLPGVDILLPDPSFIEERNDTLAGLIITHAHEDHIGGVAALWPRLKCPVYATPFTMEVLKRKLSEVPHGNDVPLKEIKNQGIVKIGPFETEWINMAHSIPDTSSLYIKTPAGSVLHSGDWNFDPKPMAGFEADKARLKKLGEQGGVTAYVGDSTNAQVPGRSGSESDLHADFDKIFARAKRKIAITLFSSNIGRLKTVVKTAKKHDRFVCMVGRSLKNMADVARKHDILDDDGVFISEDDAAYFPDDKVCYVMTGSQGEGRAQLPKAAKGEHNTITLGEGDIVLFSARAIPGNERAIIDMRNKLVSRGVEVITPKSAHIHVSGHPARDEVIEMFNLVKPNAVIPVHGEREQQEAHAEIAKECQVHHTIVPENGAIIHITNNGIEQIGQVETELLAVDDMGRILAMDHPAVRERRKLSFNGTALLSLVLKGDDIEDMQLSTLGLVDEESEEDQHVINEALDVVDEAVSALSTKEFQNTDIVGEVARIALRRYFRSLFSIKPIVIVHTTRL